MPLEYCEFGAMKAKCQAWLHAHHPDLYASAHAELEASLAALSVEEQAEVAKAERKQARKEAREAEKATASGRVVLTRIERNKRKCVLTVSGLEGYGLELKKVAKLFASKFACGSTVTKNAQGEEEILIQGDVGDDVYDYLTAHHPEIPEEHIEMVEGGKAGKKK